MTRETLIAALWSRGDLVQYKCHAGQHVIEKAFNHTNASLAVMLCARRFGKTYWACVKALEVALKKPRGRVIIATAFQSDIVEIVRPLFDQILNDCPENLRPKWLESKRKFIFQNKAEIVLVGLDKNPDGGRGRYCDLYIVDEAGFIKSGLKYLYESVIFPMTMNRKGARVVMISTPPRVLDHPFIGFYERAKLAGASVKLTIYDNPLVSSETAAKFKKETLDDVTWRREYLCEIIRDETSVIVPEWQQEFIQPVAVPEYPVHWYGAMDIGVRDKTFYFQGFYDHATSKFYATAEASMSGKDMTTELIATRLTEVSGDTKFYRRIADNSHPLLLSDLAYRHKMSFVPTRKLSLVEMVNRLRIFVKAGRLIIDPSCKELILNLETAQWNSKRSEFERSEAIGHADGLAALVYMILNIDEHTNPVPATYGKSAANHYFNQSEHTEGQTSSSGVLSALYGRNRRKGM